MCGIFKVKYIPLLWGKRVGWFFRCFVWGFGFVWGFLRGVWFFLCVCFLIEVGDSFQS